MIVNLKVTKDDIKKGKRLSTSRCPVACCLKRMGFRLPFVSALCGISFHKNRKLYNGKPPTRVLRFIRRFDKGCTVCPFKAKLTVQEIK